MGHFGTLIEQHFARLQKHLGSVLFVVNDGQRPFLIHFLIYLQKKPRLLAHWGQIISGVVYTAILPDWTLKKFCLPALLGIHQHPMQKEFMKSCEGFLRAALTGHGHPGPLWKIAKMALFNPCMELKKILGQMSSFDALWKCHLVIFSQKCPKLCPSAFLSG